MTITHRYPNGTVVDASAPVLTVESFFSTEMHSVQQGTYGQRYANVSGDDTVVDCVQRTHRIP